MLKKLITALFFTSSAALAQTTLQNPILAGFYPDPSILKVNADYYLINSTFSYFPGIPIFHSKDLKNWKQIGNAIDRPAQMDFMHQRVTRGLFAPAINYHKGTYYITCTNIDLGGNFIITATNPAGPWSNPIFQREVRGIDPSLLFDGDRIFIVYNSEPPENKSLYSGHRTIRMYELDPVTLGVKGKETILVNGGVDITKKPSWIEGPHLYKRNGFYYLMAAEGGTSVNHSEVIFRSKDVYGPYIPWEHNPILTQRDLSPDRKDPITSVGHADLVEGPDGKTYAVFLGVRPYEGDYYNTGRETFIAPVQWTTDGWPIINPGNQEVQYKYKVGWKESPQKEALPVTGNFSYTLRFADSLSSQFQFLRTKDTSWYSLSANKGSLTMKLLPETVSGVGNPAFIGKRQQHLTCSAAVEMDFSATRENEKAGLLIFQNEKHFYYICKSIEKGKGVLQLFKADDSASMVLLKEVVLPASQAKVYLKISADKAVYSFHYALSKDKWQVLQDNVDGKYLSTHVAGGFVGAFFAMYTTSLGNASGNKAMFKWFSYEGNDSAFK